MEQRNGVFVAVLAAVVGGLVFGGSAFAQLSCRDVKYGNPNYQEKMDELAKRAGLPDNYWSRYHEAVVSDLCKGNAKGVDDLIDSGYVKAREAQSIAKVLGKSYKPKERTEAGKSYAEARRKFSDMGACSACADNIAQWYTKEPDSPCGKLAKEALGGKQEAVKKLVDFPGYCEWKY